MTLTFDYELDAGDPIDFLQKKEENGHSFTILHFLSWHIVDNIITKKMEVWGIVSRVTKDPRYAFKG